MDTNDTFSRIWAAFDAGQILPACAWCGRVQVDETWVVPSPGILAAIDERYMFSHTICNLCVQSVTAKAAATLAGPQPPPSGGQPRTSR